MSISTEDIIDLFFPLQQAHPLLPEIQAHVMCNSQAFEGLQALVSNGAIDDFWIKNKTLGRVYVGGAHLSRYILDNPHVVRGKRIVDVGSGSGIVAIAASMAGAKEVVALENDKTAIHFINRNTQANEVSILVRHDNVLTTSFKDIDVITAADVFLAQAFEIERTLIAQVKKGITVFAASGGFISPNIQTHGTPLELSERAKLHGRPDMLVRMSPC